MKKLMILSVCISLLVGCSIGYNIAPTHHHCTGSIMDCQQNMDNM